MVLLHDDWMTSLRLLAGAPVSFPSWRRRVGITPAGARRKTGSRAVRAESTLMLLVSGNRRRGAEVFGERLAAGLRNRGWRVELVAITGEEEGPWIPTDAVLSDHGYASGRFDPALVWQLRSRVKVLKPDVVVANGGSTLRYGAAALAGIVDAPELVYISIGEPTYWLRGRRHIALQRFLHRRADRTIAVSEMTRRQLVEHLGVDPDRVIVAHTGVPDEFFDTEPIPRSDEIRLLFMGNLSKEKAPDVALDVVDRLKDLTPARLRFVGGGPMMERLRRLATELDIEEHVEFAGSVDNVRPHLAWADALLLTSLTEGFPGAVLEAGAAGVPSAAFSVGGTAETIIDGQTGLLFPPGDIDGLVLGLERLATDRAWCARLGEAARELVASRFRLEHSVDRFDDILRSRISMTAS